jgi:hypothetical protein
MKSADRICWTDLAIIALTWVISLVLLGFVARLSWSLLTIGWSIL